MRSWLFPRPTKVPTWLALIFLGVVVMAAIDENSVHRTLPFCATLCFFVAAIIGGVGEWRKRKEKSDQEWTLASAAFVLPAGILSLSSHARENNAVHLLIGFAATVVAVFSLFVGVCAKIGSKKPGHKK